MVRARRSPVPDGRVNNGGSRVGTPGQAYTNRSDLRTQKIQTVPGQQYGQAAAQTASQQAVPMAGAAPLPTAPPGQGPMAQGPPPTPPDLYRPTERPDEPMTHGLPTGPGAGPEALRMTGPAPNPAMTDPVAIQMRALYQKYVSGAGSSPSVAADLAAALGEIR